MLCCILLTICALLLCSFREVYWDCTFQFFFYHSSTVCTEPHFQVPVWRCFATFHISLVYYIKMLLEVNILIEIMAYSAFAYSSCTWKPVSCLVQFCTVLLSNIQWCYLVLLSMCIELVPVPDLDLAWTKMRLIY